MESFERIALGVELEKQTSGLVICLWLVSLITSSGRIEETPIIPRVGEPPGFSENLSKSALDRTSDKVTYDPKYVALNYPNGDVPADTGVCTDVVIRSYRALGIDLQKDVHEDMTAHFDAFPSKKIWGLNKPDSNIDHRRVPNLRAFFARQGEQLPITSNSKDYVPGDLVTWRVFDRPHIGIVVNRRKQGKNRCMVVHNIGNGPELEDMLFRYRITGHYRYYGSPK